MNNFLSLTYKNLSVVVVITAAVFLGLFAGVGSLHAAVEVSIGASPSEITAGNTTRISWSATEADTCIGSGFSTGGATSGSVVVSPSVNTTYSVNCSAEEKSEEICVSHPVGFGFDGECNPVAGTTDTYTKQCSNFNIQESVCRGSPDSGCRIENLVYNKNTCAVCDVDFDYCQTTTTDASSDSASVVVKVNDSAPAPTVTISLSPKIMKAPGSYTISWSSANATQCSGGGFSTGGGTSGSLVSYTEKSVSHSVTCRGPGGSTTASDSLSMLIQEETVPVIPEPTASLYATPSSITTGDSSTLVWSSEDATECTGSGFSTGGATSGSVAVSPSVDTVYSVACTNGSQSGSDSTSIRVSPATNNSNNPTALLSISPRTVNMGDSYTISWSSTNSSDCRGDGINNFYTGTRTSGSATRIAGSSVTHSVTCRGPGGSASASDSLTVVQPVVQPEPQAQPEPSSGPYRACEDEELQAVIGNIECPEDVEPQAQPEPQPVAFQNCSFGSGGLVHGDSFTAYQFSSVDYDTGFCPSEQRYCNNGRLSGSYVATSCVVESPLDVNVTCSTNNRDFKDCSGIFTLTRSTDPVYVQSDNIVESWYQCGVNEGTTVSSFNPTSLPNNAQMDFSFSSEAQQRQFNNVTFCLNSVNALDLQRTITLKLLNFEFIEN